MGTYLNKGVNFTTGQQVTATDLNNLVDDATLATGAGDGQTIEITSNTITVKDGGISPSKLSTGGPAWDTSSNVTIAGNASVTGNVTCEDVVAGGSITADDASTIKNQLDVHQNLNVGQPSNTPSRCNIEGGLTVTGGTSDFTTVTCDNLTVSGTATVGGLSVNGLSHAAGGFTVIGSGLVEFTNQQNIASITRNAAADSGDYQVYKVTMSTAANNTNYVVIPTRVFSTVSLANSNPVHLIRDSEFSTTVFNLAVHTAITGDTINFIVNSPATE
jgi:hypothetical protein